MSRVVVVVYLWGALTMPVTAAPWGSRAPEQLPPVTVTWEDTEQQAVFVVAGERYRARVATHPARILSLGVDGREVLGPDGLGLGFADADGQRYAPAPADTTPAWNVWRRDWVPAQSSRARMNVWNSGPYYWDCHLLDIPLVNDRQRAALSPADGRLLAEVPLDAGWTGEHNVTLARDAGRLRLTATGPDPYVTMPRLDVPGPVIVTVRLRAESTGGLALYWGSDRAPGVAGDRVQIVSVSPGAWREVRVPLPVTGRLTDLRLDPPGDAGTTEIEWIRILEAPRTGDLPGPVRGEVIFHAHPDQLRIELRCDPTDGLPRPARAWLEGGLPGATPGDLGGRPTLTAGPLTVLAPAGAAFDGGWSAPLTGDRPGCVWVLRPTDQAALLGDELDPLPAEAVTASGGHWLGYDANSGLYQLSAAMHGGGYGFNSAFDTPNRRIEVPLSIRADRPRRIVVKAASNTGILPATVLLDEHGFMLPTPVLSCKNFGGELEEPDDTGYGDAYFPLELPAGETRLTVCHLFQRWGAQMVKQVSSIRFFNIYWHLSTGVSETTCFTIPWMLLSDTFTVIPDYRPRSGPFWPGQPQHGVPAWPGLMEYRAGGQRVRLMYENTTFESITPCMARFTMRYRTSDGAAVAAMTATELPHDDELRTFLRLRYDWTAPATIDGDARQAFRWLNLNDRGLPTTVVYCDAEGKPQLRPIEPNDQPGLLGEPLAEQAPFLGTHGLKEEGIGHFALVRSYRARLGGVDQPRVFASSRHGRSTGNTWLTVGGEQLSLRPGDFIEAELMLMAHGEPVEPDLKPVRERLRWGTEGPTTEVKVGRLIRDFPAVVAADGEVARVALNGGENLLPLTVSGFAGWGVPLVWQGDCWQNYQAHGGDGYQVSADGDGGYRFTFLVPLRHGAGRELTVTRAAHSAGIAALRDVNGYPALTAAGEGTWQLAAPLPFAPGDTTVTRDAPAMRFTGGAATVRGVPIGLEPAGASSVLSVTRYDDLGAELRVSAAARVTVGGLAPGAAYRVVAAGTATEQAAAGGRIVVDLAADATLRVERILGGRQ